MEDQSYDFVEDKGLSEEDSLFSRFDDSDSIEYHEEWNQEKLSQAFEQGAKLIRNLSKQRSQNVTGKFEFVAIFLEEFQQKQEDQDLLECLFLFQQFLKKWRQPEDISQQGMNTEILTLITEVTTDYNQQIAPLCNQPQYSRLSSLELSQSPYREEEHQKALPLSLRQIAITDFQCIDHVQLLDLPSNAPWIVVVGENGDGKISELIKIRLKNMKKLKNFSHIV